MYHFYKCLYAQYLRKDTLCPKKLKQHILCLNSAYSVHTCYISKVLGMTMYHD